MTNSASADNTRASDTSAVARPNVPAKVGSLYDPEGISASIIPSGEPTREQMESFSFERLKYLYAQKVSVNKDLKFGAIPPTIGAARSRSLEKYPEIDDILSIVDYQGMLHSFLVGMVGAKRILEIGTFMGISAIFHANALKRNGVQGGVDETGHKPIVCLEISKDFAEIAHSNFVDAGVEDYIEVIVGDANQSLAQLQGVSFDIAFIDADKTSYVAYYETIIGNGMLNKSGIFIIDNTAFESVVAYIDAPVPVSPDYKPLCLPYDKIDVVKEWGPVLHEFNEHIRNDPRVEVVMLPLFTGITLARLVN